jgi:hypothetical protein
MVPVLYPRGRKLVVQIVETFGEKMAPTQVDPVMRTRGR